MKIGIISDTHNAPSGIDGAFQIFDSEGIQLLLHCGDWTQPATAKIFAEMAARRSIPLKGVLGNNDKDVEAFMALNRLDFELHEGVLRFDIDGKRIAVYHGHHLPTLKAVLAKDVDLLCLGHSHKPRYDRIDQKVMINPGSTAFAIPRSRTWKASVVIYDTGSHEAEFKYF